MMRRPLKQLCGYVATAAMALVLIGCHGSSGGSGASGANGTNGTNGTNGDPSSVLAGALTPAQWIALNPVGSITGVTVSATQGQPVVNFKLTDPNGNGIVGLENFTKLNPTTDLTTSYPNFTFTIAKLVPAVASTVSPGNFSAQSKWVNYIVVTTPNVSGPTSVPTGPTTDGNGMLVGHGDGTYTYTFATDITKVAAAVTAYGTTNSVDVSALDPKNLVFDPNATTRVVIEFFGNARGTGSGSHANTPTGANGNGTAEIQHPLNITYDFIPGTGAVVAPSANSREIVTLSTCNNCHTWLAYHGGHRVDPKNCVTCHTDQRKYGFTEATRNASGTAFTSGNTELVNGTAEFDFDQLIHQIHMGSNLLMTGHDITPDNTAAVSTNTLAGEYFIDFPQNAMNCTTCHVSTAATPQAGNFATTPSRAACGGCHDNVAFLLGTNHAGGAQTTDALCAGCHSSSAIQGYHTPLMSPTENGSGNWQSTSFTNEPAPATPPAHSVVYKIVSASVNSNSNPVIQFQILIDNQPITLNPFTGNLAGEALPAPFACGPNFAIAMSVPQDGIAPTYDFNYGDPDGQGANWNIRQIWNKTAAIGAADGTTPLLASKGITLVSPGTYQIIMDGFVVPATTKVVGLGMGISSVVETDLVASPNLANRPGGAPNFAFTPVALGSDLGASEQGTGGVMLPAQTVWTSATGTNLVARRTIIKPGACQTCHANLGSFTTNNLTTKVNGSAAVTSFHGGVINEGSYCEFCHMNGEVTRNGWSISAKTWVHGLHAAGMRNVPYTAQPPFASIIYPGKLNDCEACHVPGSYDFSNSANAAQIPGMLWDTVAAKRSYAAGTAWITPGFTYGPNQVFTAPSPASATWNFAQPANYGTSAVTSPITAACGACHDSQVAVSHMTNNGGVWYSLRESVSTKAYPANPITLQSNEQCLICHGSGAILDTKTVHMNF